MFHPFMGIEQWDRVGMSVEESTKRLQRIAYLDRQLMRIEAGHMASRPEYEVKGALARFTWQDADHYDQIRSRCKQLRMSPTAFEKCPDPQLEWLMRVVLESETTLHLLVALFEVVKPAIMQAIRTYLQKAQPIVDEPTIHMLNHQLIDREEQCVWGRQAVDYFSKAIGEEALVNVELWKSYIQSLIAAAGGVETDGTRIEVNPKDIVASQPFEMSDFSTRDDRFRTSIIKFADMTFEDSDAGRLMNMMLNRFFEMSPAEAIAYVHFTTEGKPWAFYHDTARHMWDEVRHSWFGEAALRSKGYDIHSFPNWTGWYDMTSNCFENDEAYTHLTISIEKSAMKYPPGKREEWEFCKDTVKDPLMATFQDFDWADEVVHAGYGKKWIIDELYNGDAQMAQEKADATIAKRKQFMAKHEGAGKESAGGY